MSRIVSGIHIVNGPVLRDLHEYSYGPFQKKKISQFEESNRNFGEVQVRSKR